MAGIVSRRFMLKAGGAGLAAGSIRRAHAQAVPIRLGFIGPLSGAAQVVGAENRTGAEVARDHVNRAGGIAGRPFELVVYDDRGDPNQTVAAVRQHAGDGVNLLLGMPLYAGVAAAIPVLADVNSMVLACGSTDERPTHELFKRNFFTVSPNNVIRYRSLAEFLAGRYPDVTTWIGIVGDGAQPRDSWNSICFHLARAHRKITGKTPTFLDPVLCKVGTTDYKQQIANLVNSPAQGLFHGLVGADGITFFKQQRAFGLDRKFSVIAENALDSDLPKTLKGAMPSDVWSTSFWSINAYPKDPDALELQRGFAAAFNGDMYPHGLSALCYIAVRAYAEAIRAAGSTETTKVIEALEGRRLDTLRGPGYFRKEDHQFLAATHVVHFMPAETAVGWGVESIFTVKDETVANPATPGVKLQL